MSVTSEPPDIFAFVDLPAYLRAWFEWWKPQSRRHSHRFLAQQLGSSDPSILVNAIEGRRALSAQRVDAMLANVLTHLDTLETRYFRALAEVERARGEERTAASERAALLRAENAATNLARERVEVLGRWWYYAIASLADGQHGVSLDEPAAVAAALYDRITPEMAAQAIQQLLHVGLLVKSEDGYRGQVPTYTTPAEVARHATRQYHTDMLRLAEAALEAQATVDKAEQRRVRFLGVTAALSEQGLDAVREALHELQQRVLAISARDAESPGPHRVYQLNLHLFPLSRGDGGTD